VSLRPSSASAVQKVAEFSSRMELLPELPNPGKFPCLVNPLDRFSRLGTRSVLRTLKKPILCWYGLGLTGRKRSSGFTRQGNFPRVRKFWEVIPSAN